MTAPAPGARVAALLPLLRDPVDGSGAARVEGDELVFEGGGRHPLVQGTPVLFDAGDSLFDLDEIRRNAPTTQSAAYRDTGSLKNSIRQRLLPTLSHDGGLEARYRALAAQVGAGRVLVIGTGDKAEFYRRCFPDADVVTSDVHCQFGVDLVLDAHSIPFADDTFALVLMPQVLEHTSRPWVVAQEAERVAAPGGLIQVEVPFAFHTHTAPYDFYRFTPSALRFLFPRCQQTRMESPEANWSGAAVALSNALICSASNRYLRMLLLVVGRFSYGWLKNLDGGGSPTARNMAKGYAATYRYDGVARGERALLAEVPIPD